MTYRHQLGMLLARLVVPGAGWGIAQPLARIAVSEGYRDFLDLWQLAIGAALVLMFAGLALVQPRPPLAGLDTPGDDAERRITETP